MSEGLELVEDTVELDGDAILASVMEDDTKLVHDFEFKDEVMIKDSSFSKYEDIKDLTTSKIGRIVEVNKKGEISVDFWDTTPAKNKIHPDDLILVSKAIDRINVAAGEEPVKNTCVSSENEAGAKPTRYTQGDIEVWDAIVGLGFDFMQGSILKYIARYQHKNGTQDLHKALNYIIKMIANNTEKDYYSIRNKTVEQITKGDY